MLEKTREHEVDTRHLFVDYKTASDSPISYRVYVALSELCKINTLFQNEP